MRILFIFLDSEDFRFLLDFFRIFSTITITRAVAWAGKWGSSDITSDEHFNTTFENWKLINITSSEHFNISNVTWTFEKPDLNIF